MKIALERAALLVSNRLVKTLKNVPKSRSRKKPPTLPGISATAETKHWWFSRNGCVVRENDRERVVVAGMLLGEWHQGETAMRNAVLVHLATDPRIVLEDLARAFQMTSEMVRRIRRRADEEGVLAVMREAKGGRPAVSIQLRQQMEKAFEEGKPIDEVHRELRNKASRSLVGRVHKQWNDAPKWQKAEPVQQKLPLSEARAEQPAKAEIAAANSPTESQQTPAHENESVPESKPVAAPSIRAPGSASERTVRATDAELESPSSIDEEEGARAQIREQLPKSRRSIANLGAWLLTAFVGKMGLYGEALALNPLSAGGRPLRVALNSLLAALGISQRTVEGVRRLATRSAGTLLLSSSAPSATWVRRVFGEFARYSLQLRERLSANWIREAHARREKGHAAVFYIDNHTREYTGKHRLTWHWKMQLKRAVRGVTDYWLHDSEGSPISCVSAPQQGSLVQFLPVFAKRLCDVLGKEAKILCVFDRGGAFPTSMTELRDLPEGEVDFLTYERAPYHKHGRIYFERHGTRVALPDPERDDKTQNLWVVDAGKNLGGGRGRVRRLSVLMEDDTQINVLTSSADEAGWLVLSMFRRWVQENAFKHGGERWGFDQLDGRQVETYPDGTLIPNPYRKGLEKLKSRHTKIEASLRCRLARLKRADPKAQQLRDEIKEEMKYQEHLAEELRKAPLHLPIEKTHLRGKLFRHTSEYKQLIDTIRIACARAESDLASLLRPNLSTPDEAKKVLANIFKAHGNLHVTEDSILLSLDAAGNEAELHAMRVLFKEINGLRLPHPADPKGRPLRFCLQRA